MKYLYYVPKMRIFNLTNEHILEFFRISEINSGLIETYLTKDDCFQIRGYLDNEINKSTQPKEFLPLAKEVGAMILNVAGASCNLNCAYCFAATSDQYKTEFMSLQTAKDAVAHLMKISPNKNNYGIIFFGGEPFLNKELIFEIADYCKRTLTPTTNKTFTFMATTNGTIFDTKIAELVRESGGNLLISIDGPEHIHDANRYDHKKQGSFKTVMQNIEKYKVHGVEVTLRPTIATDISDFLEVLDFFEQQNNPFSYEFTCKSKFKESSKCNYNDSILTNIDRQYKLGMQYYYEKIINGKSIYCGNIIAYLQRIHSPSQAKLSCSAGVEALAINPDGTIYTCQNFANDLTYSVGDIWNGINRAKRTKLISPNIDDISACTKCWIRCLCSGQCFSEKIISNESLLQPVKEKCELAKLQWSNLISLYLRLIENQPELFDNENFKKIIGGVSETIQCQ